MRGHQGKPSGSGTQKRNESEITSPSCAAYLDLDSFRGRLVLALCFGKAGSAIEFLQFFDVRPAEM